MKKIIKIIYIIGLIYLIVGTLSVLYSHFFLGGLMVSNKFDLFTKGIFNLSSYFSIIIYYFLGQKIIFYIIGQAFIIFIYNIIFISLKSVLNTNTLNR